jgi:hypothetical protein
LSSDLGSEKSVILDPTISQEQLLQGANEEGSATATIFSSTALETPKFNPGHLYEPLHDGNLTRLVEVQAGKYDDPLNLQFYYVDLQKPHLNYEALSYVWGRDPYVTIDGKYQPYKCIVHCNGHELSISANLEKAFRSLRLEDATRVIWVDAICINQEDGQERAHQVSLMSAVYKHARRVVVWLGDQDGIIFEPALAEKDNVRGERSFGAICDVVNHWLGGESSGRKASYRVVLNSRERDGWQFSGFKVSQNHDLGSSRKQKSLLEDFHPFGERQSKVRRRKYLTRKSAGHRKC